MKGSKISFLALALPLFVAGALFLNGCEFADVESILQSEDTLYEKYHNDPRFWKYATAIDGTSNLYQLQNDLFLNKPYNNLATFGDNILLIGEASYQDPFESLDMLTDGEWDEEWEEGEDLEEEEYEYSFDLYSPWRNRILASLNHDKISCDDYQIVGEYLFLKDSKKQTLSVYDSNLTLIGDFSSPGLFENTSLEIYASADPNLFYTTSLFSEDIYSFRIDASTKEISYEVTSLPLYQGHLCEDTASSDVLVAYGVDPDSFLNSICFLDSTTLTPMQSYFGYTLFDGACTEDAFITYTGDHNMWAFQENKKPVKYFTLQDVSELRLQKDHSFCISRPYTDKKTNHYIIRNFRYSSSGDLLSAFSYDCGDYESPSNTTYISNDMAYFEDIHVGFFLLYDTQSSYPYFLVWDASSSGNTTSSGSTSSAESNHSSDEASSTDKLSFYSSKSELLSVSTPNDEDSFGEIVTLIPDTSSYHWGDLEKANALARELEDTYDIEIYLGPEVPNRIDFYDIAQECDPEIVEKSLDNLKRILSCYPKNFFSQLAFGSNLGLRFYLTGTITSTEEGLLEDASGFVNEIDNHLVMVLDTEYDWDWDYTINHEMSHMIDRKLEFRANYIPTALYSEATWSSLNPSDFSYLETYEDYESNADYTKYAKYFVDAYGMTFATEDRAQIFGTAMSDYLSGFETDEVFTSSDPLLAKYHYYCDSIREGFNTKGWPVSTPWEFIE